MTNVRFGSKAAVRPQGPLCANSKHCVAPIIGPSSVLGSTGIAVTARLGEPGHGM